jgi:L-alanine-DL-glutamate epimerase-like enolase superfamily enzyme
VIVEAVVDGSAGLGWTYSTAAAKTVVDDIFAPALVGKSLPEVRNAWEAMHRAARNIGTRGLVMQALSAVDIALWDATAKAQCTPLTELFHANREAVPVYGSGGFTSMTSAQLDHQLDDWLSRGCTAVKIKIGEAWGTNVERDLARVRQARRRVGRDVQVFVDANGAYTRALARGVGAALYELGVSWFEEPVTSDDPDGLAMLRHQLRCDVAAGEYVSDVVDASVLIPAVDCLQLDVTRCGGYTGFLRCAALARRAGKQVSGHCAPALHAPVVVAVPNLRHVELFADHERLEPELVDGAPIVKDGLLHPNDAPGHGYTLRAA